MPLGLSKNLFQRIVSAILLLPPVLGALWAGGWWFSAFLALGGVLMAREWVQLTVKDRFSPAVLPIIILFLVAGIQLEKISTGNLALGAGVLLLLSLVSAVTKTARPLGWFFAGLVYVILPLAALWWLRQVDAMLVFWVFLVTWATDVGGYFFGKGIGGPKLAPRISPKKTWAGLLGGMLLSGIVGTVLNLGFNVGGDAAMFIVISAGMAVLSQAGDLLESYVKRIVGAKDSGELIPGHGGLLDRVDGLVTTAPAVVLLVVLYPVGMGV
jgi:phosphatidate cytidylyltransferase